LAITTNGIRAEEELRRTQTGRGRAAEIAVEIRFSWQRGSAGGDQVYGCVVK